MTFARSLAVLISTLGCLKGHCRLPTTMGQSAPEIFVTDCPGAGGKSGQDAFRNQVIYGKDRQPKGTIWEHPPAPHRALTEIAARFLPQQSDKIATPRTSRTSNHPAHPMMNGACLSRETISSNKLEKNDAYQ
jgi:hypothetical protein